MSYGGEREARRLRAIHSPERCGRKFTTITDAGDMIRLACSKQKYHDGPCRPDEEIVA